MERTRFQSPASQGDQAQPAERRATGNKKGWQGTLDYWLECGIEFRSGDRLEFVTPPPRVRTGKGGGGAQAPSARPPVLWMPAATEVQRTPVPPPPPPPAVVQTEAPWSEPLPAAKRPAVLALMAEEVEACTRCPLVRTRTHSVFGVGNPNADVVFVGEGPGAEEDIQGEPFVGAAGRLLDQMLRAVRMQRSDVYIANVVKCRPPGNRNPHPEEMVFCQGYLFRQLEIIRPRVIFCLGKFAILCLTGHAEAVGLARGKPFFWHGIPVIASYHPAYYLRTPSRKRAAWEDLLWLSKLLAKQKSPQADAIPQADSRI